MPDKALQISSGLKFAVYIVWLVILILNFAVGIIFTLWWKSWKNFKEDQKTALLDFFTNHAKEHDFLSLRITTIAESITALFAKEDGNRDIVIKTETDIKNTDEKLKDHIRRCEKRDQCHDRRKNDR